MTRREPGAPAVHPIEVESYEILRERVDLTSFEEPARQIVARMVHASADESFAVSALVGPVAVQEAVAALRRGGVVVCDTNMVVAGIPGVAASNPVVCYLDRVPELEVGLTAGTDATAENLSSDSSLNRKTRSAKGIELAAADHPVGAIWVIGNAPTALDRLVDLHSVGRLRPAAVVGLPVGYVGAEESKSRLWASSLRSVSITNDGRRGGSAVAAAAVNALARMARR